MSILTYDWTSYGNAIATGLRRQRDNSLPLNPAIQAVRDGDDIAFEFGADTSLVPDERVVWESRNFDAGDYLSDDFEEATDEYLAETAAWYGSEDGRDSQQQVRRAIEEAVEENEAA